MEKLVKNKLLKSDLYASKEFWYEYFQNELFNKINQYLIDNNLNNKEFAEKLGVSKGYVSQLLNGETDHRISKIIELSLAINMVPYVYFKSLDQVLDSIEKGDSVFLDFEKADFSKNIFRKEKHFKILKKYFDDSITETSNVNFFKEDMIEVGQENMANAA